MSEVARRDLLTVAERIRERALVHPEKLNGLVALALVKMKIFPGKQGLRKAVLAIGELLGLSKGKTWVPGIEQSIPNGDRE